MKNIKKLIIMSMIGVMMLSSIGVSARPWGYEPVIIDNVEVDSCLGFYGWKEVNGNKYYLISLDVQKGWMTLLDHEADVPWGVVPPKLIYYLDETTGKMTTNAIVDGLIIGPDGLGYRPKGIKPPRNKTIATSITHITTEAAVALIPKGYINK